jgi:peptidoglycan hydrolase FlgJ
MSTVPLPKLDTTTPLYHRLFKQAQDLEGVFMNTLMKEMFSSIKTDDADSGGSAGGDFGQETWRGMQAEQMADAVAKQGGIGLAQQLMPTLMSLQEAKPQSGTGFQQ